MATDFTAEIELADLDQWEDFTAAHGDLIRSTCGTVEAAEAKACQGGLVLRIGDESTLIYFAM